LLPTNQILNLRWTYILLLNEGVNTNNTLAKFYKTIHFQILTANKESIVLLVMYQTIPIS